MMLNLGCGPFRAPDPWWNVDVTDRGSIDPDQVIDPDRPLPYRDESCERVYLGHVLEHVPWCQIPRLLGEVHRVLWSDGDLLVVGPDVERAIRYWHDGDHRYNWQLVIESLEGAHSSQPDGEWDGGRHHWNCTEARLVEALEGAGFTTTPVPVDDQAPFDGWPLVSYMPHQAAVWGRK